MSADLTDGGFWVILILPGRIVMRPVFFGCVKFGPFTDNHQRDEQ